MTGARLSAPGLVKIFKAKKKREKKSKTILNISYSAFKNEHSTTPEWNQLNQAINFVHFNNNLTCNHFFFK